MSSNKKISVVTSAYNEEDCVDELGSRLAEVFDSLPQYEFEVIAVDNGSHDATFDRLKALRDRDERFKVVQLSRTFSFESGLTAGLSMANGAAAVLMASDLQDPPEMLREFLAHWEDGYEDVYGVIVKRGGTNWLRRINSRLFYWLLGRLSEQTMPANARDFRLLDRRVYEQVLRMTEPYSAVRGIAAWTGFRSVGVEFEQPERFAGTTKTSSRGVSELAVRTIFTQSLTPLRVMPVIGVGLLVISILALIGLTLNTLINGVPFPGFGTIVAVVLLMSGLLFSFLSVIGIYVGLTYELVRPRPNFIVRQTIGLDDREPNQTR